MPRLKTVGRWIWVISASWFRDSFCYSGWLHAIHIYSYLLISTVCISCIVILLHSRFFIYACWSCHMIPQFFFAVAEAFRWRLCNDCWRLRSESQRCGEVACLWKVPVNLSRKVSKYIVGTQLQYSPICPKGLALFFDVFPTNQTFKD